MQIYVADFAKIMQNAYNFSSTFVVTSSNRSCTQMNDRFELFLLEAAKRYLKSLSNEDFLALTCDIYALITGLVRLVRNESAARNINATDNTAQTFHRSKRHIRRILQEK